MDAPKCRLCGERHYGLCKHAQSRATPASVDAPKRAVVETLVAKIAKPQISDKHFQEMQGAVSYGSKEQPLVLSPVLFKAVAAEYKARGLEMPGSLIQTKPTPTIGFDRTSYQRDYMRKRRAKLKEDQRP